ncbi:DNA binding protein, putative [Ricinus communis]|uniref:DNA binding protein, putative n=1 Tax=Ricinus communis TaxID=3988 RepID=B9T523_RICCO|nr:DNA binding protein, putative [Ricinus communis]
MVADNGNSNTYEEARKLRLKENKKRFEDLGISKISKSLSNLTTPEKKTKMDIDLPPLRKSSSWTVAIILWIFFSYVARPLDEVKLASYEDRTRALKAAEEFQNSLQSGNPSFVKSMVRSHVYSCFWLGLPTQFCKNHLPKKDLDMILEDDNGSTYDAKYLGNRTGLSGGWRGFALDHKLDDGDAVVFELVEPDKFKHIASSFKPFDMASSEK